MAFRGSSDVGAFLAGLEPEKEFRSRPIREFSEERSRPIRDFDEEPSVPFFVVDHRPVPDEPRRRYFETDHAPSFSAAAGGTESKTSEPPNLDDARWIEVVGASESEALGELKLKVAETWPGGENWCYIKCQTMEDAAKLLNSRSTVLRDKRVVFNKPQNVEQNDSAADAELAEEIELLKQARIRARRPQRKREIPSFCSRLIELLCG